MEEGHVAKHAVECIKKMKKDGEISYDARTPLLTYENYKSEKKVDYRIIKNENY